MSALDDLIQRVRAGLTTDADAWLVIALRSRAERAEAERDALHEQIGQLSGELTQYEAFVWGKGALPAPPSWAQEIADG